MSPTNSGTKILNTRLIELSWSSSPIRINLAEAPDIVQQRLASLLYVSQIPDPQNCKYNKMLIVLSHFLLGWLLCSDGYLEKGETVFYD